MACVAGNLAADSATTSTLATTFPATSSRTGFLYRLDSGLLALWYGGEQPGSALLSRDICSRPMATAALEAWCNAAIAEEVLRALGPMAIETALEAERRHMDNQSERY
jgi:hypothetical protein